VRVCACVRACAGAHAHTCTRKCVKDLHNAVHAEEQVATCLMSSSVCSALAATGQQDASAAAAAAEGQLSTAPAGKLSSSSSSSKGGGGRPYRAMRSSMAESSRRSLPYSLVPCKQTQQHVLAFERVYVFKCVCVCVCKKGGLGGCACMAKGLQEEVAFCALHKTAVFVVFT